MSSISSIGSSSNWVTQLFSKLDTSGQGYLSKSDLETAMTNATSSSSSTSSSTSSTSSADSLFSQLDTNGDGKVTKQEFTDTLTKLAEQLASQAMQANGGMQGSGMGGGMSAMGGGGGMPPPPPPDSSNGNDSGFTKDELTSQLNDIGSSDSKRSSLISNIVNNFDKADTNGDGKVDMQEAMAYNQSTSSTSSSSASASTSSTATDTSTSTSSTDLNLKLLQQIMQLMQAYNVGSDQNSSSLLSTLSVTA